MPQMIHPQWAVSLIKRGSCVMVNVNFSTPSGLPARWAVGTHVGTAQSARLTRVVFDDTGGHDLAGTTNVVASCRVRPARYQH